MVSFKAVIRAQRRRPDGTYNVQIRITHNRKSIYIPTTLSVTASDLTRGGKLKSPEAIRKAGEMVSEMWRAASAIPPFTLADMTVREVAATIRREQTRSTFHLDFYEYAAGVLEEKGNQGGSGKTAELYRMAVRSLRNYHPGPLEINDITARFLRGWLDQMDCRASTKDTYLAKIAYIYRRAREQYNDEDEDVILIPRDPFRRVKVGWEPSDAARRPLTVEQVQTIIDQPATLRPYIRTALDLWLLSFCLMGMNEADMREAAAPKDGWLRYRRRKVRNRARQGARMQVRVPAQAEPYLRRLADPSGAKLLRHLSIPDGIRDALRTWVTETGLEDDYSWLDGKGARRYITLYSARHTWATLARKAGQEKATVDEALGHAGDLPMADVYIERDWATINKANDAVLALFRWPELEQGT